MQATLIRTVFAGTLLALPTAPLADQYPSKLVRSCFLIRQEAQLIR